MASELYRGATVFDGLIVANFGPELFRAMHRAGLTGVNCTCCVWEDLPTTIRAMARWKGWFHEHADILRQVFTTADIAAAKREGRVGIVLGWQNATGFGDDAGTVRLFKDLGLGIVQLTYNTATTVGSGCYESHDGGLTDFGHELVAEMNAAGIAVDLSHVGAKTADDAIRASTVPCTYSHCCPAGLKAHPRNKTDEQLRFIAEKGGFVGVTVWPTFLEKGPASNLDDVVRMIEYVIDRCGEAQVGIGTDFTEDHEPAFFRYITHDKGFGRKLTDFGQVLLPEGLRRIDEWPNVADAMVRRGWKEARIEAVLGANWVNYLKQVWGA